MTADVAIRAERVSKKYCKALKKSMLYGMLDIGRNIVGLSSHSETLRPGEFLAVDDVSFEVKRGETLGLIGPNGSGKTTLLKMLNGIFWPDKGKITVHGRVGALIAVGAGFHPLLSGRENIYINGAILGMERKEIDRNFDAIVDFADIGDFLDSPVKHYSSGMYVRLGFAVAAHLQPDLLLIDEVLAVGDMVFMYKCLRKIKELRDAGTTIVFVSHNLNSVAEICDRAALLHEGKIRYYGDVDKAIYAYHELMGGNGRYTVEEKVFGPSKVEIRNVVLLDGAGNRRDRFEFGERVILRIEYYAHTRIQEPSFNIAFHGPDGIRHLGFITSHEGYQIDAVDGAGVMDLEIDALYLKPGTFQVNLGIYDQTGMFPYVYRKGAAMLKVGYDRKLGTGLFFLPHRWRLAQK